MQKAEGRMKNEEGFREFRWMGRARNGARTAQRTVPSEEGEMQKAEGRIKPHSPQLRESEANGARGINNGRIVRRNILFISNLSGIWRSALLGGVYDRNTCITSSTAMAQQIQPLVFRRENRPVMLVTFHDRLHVSPGAGVIHPGQERRAVGRRRAAVAPLQNARAAGVVIGQRVRQGIVGSRVTSEELAQIPGAGPGVFDRIKHLKMGEQVDVFFRRPFLGGLLADLHQADLSLSAARARIEPAFRSEEHTSELQSQSNL